MRILGNTLFISVMKIVLVFPVPIILAIMITEVQNKPASKAIQSIIYLPAFSFLGDRGERFRNVHAP